MKYADFENGRYEARLDRAKRNVEDYMHKNHVHVFDKKKHKEVATINGAARNVTYQSKRKKDSFKLAFSFAYFYAKK